MKKYFNILAPFVHSTDIEKLKRAGADELYCGFVTRELSEKWPIAFNILNRRGEGQSFENYDVFKEAVDCAERNKLPVYVTVNGLYTPEQYPFLLNLFKKIEILSGVTGVIIADIGLLLTLKKKKFRKEIHISTGGTSFNSNTIDFYRDLGGNRVILPRQLTVNEIADIFKKVKSDIDIELFILSESCGGFIDGLCTFFHCFEKKMTEDNKLKSNLFLKQTFNTEQSCKGCNFFSKYIRESKFKVYDAEHNSHEKKNDLGFESDKHSSFGCRICELYRFKDYPVKSLKIVGRGKELGYIVKLVKVASKVRDLLFCDNIMEREYINKCKKFFYEDILENKRKCTKFDCYFNKLWIENGKSIVNK